jgi:hypothetical protein
MLSLSRRSFGRLLAALPFVGVTAGAAPAGREPNAADFLKLEGVKGAKCPTIKVTNLCDGTTYEIPMPVSLGEASDVPGGIAIPVKVDAGPVLKSLEQQTRRIESALRNLASE